jgi:hypothetical protein
MKASTRRSIKPVEERIELAVNCLDVAHVLIRMAEENPKLRLLNRINRFVLKAIAILEEDKWRGVRD